MDEEQWKDYSMPLSSMQRQSPEESNWSQAGLANLATNSPYWFRNDVNAMQNIAPPKVVTDRIWNEDIW